VLADQLLGAVVPVEPHVGAVHEDDPLLLLDDDAVSRGVDDGVEPGAPLAKRALDRPAAHERPVGVHGSLCAHRYRL